MVLSWWCMAANKCAVLSHWVGGRSRHSEKEEKVGREVREEEGEEEEEEEEGEGGGGKGEREKSRKGARER